MIGVDVVPMIIEDTQIGVSALKRSNVVAVLAMLGGLLVAATCAAWAADIPEHLAPYWGREITAGELLRATDPGRLDLLPRDAWDTPVTWGGGGQMKARPMENEPCVESDSALDVDLPRGGDDTESSVSGIVINCTYKFTANGLSVDHGASNTMVWPLFYRIPYMLVATYLIENDYLISTASDNRSNVWRLTCNDTVPVGGDAFSQATSYHDAEFLAGDIQPSEFMVLASPTKWIEG